MATEMSSNRTIEGAVTIMSIKKELGDLRSSWIISFFICMPALQHDSDVDFPPPSDRKSDFKLHNFAEEWVIFRLRAWYGARSAYVLNMTRKGKYIPRT